MLARPRLVPGLGLHAYRRQPGISGGLVGADVVSEPQRQADVVQPFQQPSLGEAVEGETGLDPGRRRLQGQPLEVDGDLE